MASLILNRGQIAANIKEFLASTYTDMNAISSFDAAPGSKCLCLDSFIEYILSPDNIWVEIPKSTTNNNSNSNINLEGYATKEYVDERIAFLLNNNTIDLDSITELADLLQKGGADLVEIRAQIENIIQALDTKCPMDTFTNYAVEADKKHGALEAELQQMNKTFVGYKNDMAKVHNMQAQVDAKLMSDINAIEETIEDIKIGEAMYRAQELGPVDLENVDYDIKHYNNLLSIDKRTGNSIVGIELQGNDIILKKFSGTNISETPIQYQQVIEDQQLIGNPTKKPLCLVGVLEHAASADGWKFVLDKVNTGYGFASDCFDVAFKEGYDDGTKTPCVKIGDYYYEIVYNRRYPKQLKLLGRFIDGVWNDGLIEADVNYKTVIDLIAGELIDTGIGRFYRTYENAKKTRVVLYLSYYEENGQKIGPFGAAITNGEFQVVSDLNVNNAKKNKYYIDNYRLISHLSTMQQITLDELASGRGNIITGISPSVTNNGFSWGTNNVAVTDDAERLGTFSYLTKNHNLELSTQAHPVGNYAIEKIEGRYATLITGELISFTEAMVRGFDLTMHPEFYPEGSESGKMYIQFISGRVPGDMNTIRHFYRTLTAGYEVENGVVTERRRTWSPLTEILTTVTLQKELQKIESKYDEQLSALEDRINELMIQINDLQTRVIILESETNVPDDTEPEPYFTAPDAFVLNLDTDNSYGGMISGTYYPIDATMSFVVIVTDTSEGDGGKFYQVTDSMAWNGHYEVTVHDTPGAAGTPHPSALKITLTTGDVIVEKILPIELSGN